MCRRMLLWPGRFVNIKLEHCIYIKGICQEGVLKSFSLFMSLVVHLCQLHLTSVYFFIGVYTLQFLFPTVIVLTYVLLSNALLSMFYYRPDYSTFLSKIRVQWFVYSLPWIFGDGGRLCWWTSAFVFSDIFLHSWLFIAREIV